MIKLTKIDGGEIYINERHIESIEANPNTTIKIHEGTVHIVTEQPHEVLELMREWKRGLTSQRRRG